MLLISVNANAGLIEIKPDHNNVNVGETIDITLAASDFASFDIFDLDFFYDTSLFTIDLLSLQSDLPLDDGYLTLGLIASSGVNNLALSFYDFTPFVGGDFLLVKFTLTAIKSGVSNFTLGNVAFYEPFVNYAMTDIDSFDRNSAKINNVPEPATWLLLLIPSLVMLRKRAVK